MSDADKLLWMFAEVHGHMSGACYLEIAEDEEGNAKGVRVMEHGHLCWEANKTDLMFDYLTKHLDT